MEGVVVTGMGIISPLGVGVEENHFRLCAGKDGLSKAEFFESRYVDHFPFGEVKISNEALRDLSGSGDFTGFTRTCQLAFIAFREAIEDAGLTSEQLHSFDTGFISASTVGGMCYTDQLYADANEVADASEFVQSYPASAHTMHLAKHFGIRGFLDTINTACSSSANAIALGFRLISSGRLKRAIVGGADSLAKYTVNGFNSLRILSEDFCRPFDADRDGLNLGEGAAYLVLERSSDCHGKKSHGQLLGFGNSNDAYHASAISPEARGVIKAIEGALNTSGLRPEQIGYINTHGTGTLNNDEMEIVGMQKIFGNLPPFSSTKSYTGHTLGAAGSVEAVFGLLSLNHGEIYPNLRFEQPISPYKQVPVQSFRSGAEIDFVLSNSFGFSGNCTSLVFGK